MCRRAPTRARAAPARAGLASIGETVAGGARRSTTRTTERAECFRIWINKRRCLVSVFNILIYHRHSGDRVQLNVVCGTVVSSVRCDFRV